MSWTEGDQHLPDCAVGQLPPGNRRFCLLTGKPHRWSGTPGAYCQDCGLDDLGEICIGRVCPCPCHDKFWAEYAASESERMRRNRRA